jgi:hypothetical protein
MLRCIMRIYDAEIVNAIALQVADELGGLYDFSAPISEPKNVFLLNGGIACCIWSAPQVYECHLLFPPEIRGGQAVRRAREMADFMFANYAKILWCRPPVTNRAAIWLIRQVGFVEQSRGLDKEVGQAVYLVRTV